MIIKIDLHTHTTASDGVYSPSELVSHAHSAGVEILAVTDHDTVDGLEEAQVAAKTQGIQLIPGAEFSATWAGMTLHVLGLGFDPSNRSLQQALAEVQSVRDSRAKVIGEKLERLGIANAYQRTHDLTVNGNLTRTHFAQLLVNDGRVRTRQEAFKRFLGQGRGAYVSCQWPPMAQVIGRINTAGGKAVVAHLQRYKLNAKSRAELVKDFARGDGAGLEWAPSISAEMIRLARQFDLKSTVGSDFHAPRSGPNLGSIAPPTEIPPLFGTPII